MQAVSLCLLGKYLQSNIPQQNNEDLIHSMLSSTALDMAIDKHLTQLSSPQNTQWYKVEANSIYGLLPTGIQELLLKIILSSIQSSSVDLGMVNEDFKIELKPMVCENATVSLDVMKFFNRWNHKSVWKYKKIC